MKTETENLRELDVFCAEFVMGLKRVDSVLKIERGLFCPHPSDGVVYIHEYQNRIIRFCPTTDPAAAMQVLEKCVLKLELKRAFPAIEKYSDLDGFQGRKVSALFSTGNQDTFSEVAETLPLAICKFAKALYSQ